MQNVNAVTFAQGIAALRAHYNAGSKDIQAVLSGRGKFGYTEQIHAAMIAHGVNPLELFELPQKQVKRAVQMVHAIVTKTYRDIDATTACGLYALNLSPDDALSFDTLHLLIAGIARTDGATGDTKGVQRSRLARMFSRVGVNTVSTQKSRSWGDNGFCQALGVTFAPVRTQDRVVTLNREHPLTVAFLRMVDGATDAQIDQIGGKTED
jgi:hypothetical protein